MTTEADLAEKVDWTNGSVSADIFFDQDVYDQELERVFGRSWLVVGHEDMVREPGDYVTNYMGEVPVILLRDRGNEIRVLVNRCSHRGNSVCLFDRGSTRAFTCSYHGWTYDLSGKLVSVPMEQELYHNDLNKDALGLEPVPKVASFYGLVFACLDAGAPDLEDWLGEDVCWWLKNMVLVPHLGGLEALPGWHRYHSPANWKLAGENFSGDDYHFMSTHMSFLIAIQTAKAQGMRHPLIMDATADRVIPDYPLYEVTAGYGRGCPMGMGGVVLNADAAHATDLRDAEELGSEAVEWVTERYRRHREALKGTEPLPHSVANGLVFPNFGFLLISAFVGHHFLLFQPRGPLEHEVWQWTMVERDAPEIIKEINAQRVCTGQHMAGILAPDDVENFERLVEAMRTPRARKRPLHYGLQFGHEKEGPRSLPGNVGPNPSEVNQREFYRFWLELMGGA